MTRFRYQSDGSSIATSSSSSSYCGQGGHSPSGGSSQSDPQENILFSPIYFGDYQTEPLELVVRPRSKMTDEDCENDYLPIDYSMTRPSNSSNRRTTAVTRFYSEPYSGSSEFDLESEGRHGEEGEGGSARVVELQQQMTSAAIVNSSSTPPSSNELTSRCPDEFHQQDIGVSTHKRRRVGGISSGGGCTAVGTTNNSKPFTCSICFKSYARRSHLNIHFRVHTGERPFLCSMCDKDFTEKRFLNDHIQTAHSDGQTNGEPLLCPNCKREFAYKTSLKQHLKKQMCLKNINRSLQLTTNLNSSQPTGMGFDQIALEAAFRNRKSTVSARSSPLLSNKNVVVTSTAGNMMSSSFTANSSAGMTHSSEKQFGCPFCRKSYSWKQTLKQHISMYHPMSRIDLNHTPVFDAPPLPATSLISLTGQPPITTLNNKITIRLPQIPIAEDVAQMMSNAENFGQSLQNQKQDTTATNSASSTSLLKDILTQQTHHNTTKEVTEKNDNVAVVEGISERRNCVLKNLLFKYRCKDRMMESTTPDMAAEKEEDSKQGEHAITAHLLFQDNCSNMNNNNNMVQQHSIAL